MFTYKTLLKGALIATITAVFSACGNDGNTNSSTTPATSITPTASISPNGVATLPNGAQISPTQTTLFTEQGESATALLSIAGGSTQESVAYSTEVYKFQNGILTPSSDLNVALNMANHETGNNRVGVSRLLATASQNAIGTYIVKVVANVSNSSTKTALQASTPYIVASIPVNVSSSSALKASYLQLDAVGSLGAITSSGYGATNVMIFAFANISDSSVNSAYLSAMQTAINNQSSGTINLLSIGGQYATSTNINQTTAANIVTTVSNQIKAYNAKLSNGQITGVDLDLENGIDAATILALAKGFHDLGYVVSTAPQVYLQGSGSNVSSANPTNLVLTSGATGSDFNQYGQAIASGYVDYIMAQTYNTSGWTVDNVSESEPSFFQKIALALNNTVKANCAGIAGLCIPSHTNILIGQVSNAGASGTVNNVFASNGTTPYNQATVLNQLLSYITAVEGNTNYNYIKGVMQWSLNNDYSPSSWGDNSASSGAFSSTIFGATPPPSVPYFTVQITNTGPNVAGPYAYASATLIVNGAYYVFGSSWSSPIAPQANVTYGTKPSANANPNVVTYSSSLDSFFSGGATSFTANIQINGYPSQTGLDSPARSYVCKTNQTFQAGKSYNIMVDPTTNACDVSSW